MDPLERSYRRWLRLFPGEWRHRRKEEVLSVLLQVARPGQERASEAERRDLVGAATAAWARTTTAAVRRAPGRAAGAAVLVVGLAAVLLPTAAAHQSDADALPSVLPGYGFATGSVSGSPPGPAVALYQQGFGVELFDTPQAVVVGAGGSVRRLDLAEGRGEGAQGDPGAMLLSPDGTRVAVGRYDAAEADVAVQDLRTGEVVRSAVLGSGAVLPLAWAPDGSELLAVVLAAGWNPYGGDGGPPAGALVRLGADGGSRPALAGAPELVAAAAFSPDGRRLALQDPGGELVLLDLGTGTSTPLDAGGGGLAGPAAWSPDGQLLALSGTCAVEGSQVLQPLPGEVGRLPWPATGTVLLSTDPATTAPPCVPDGRGYASFVGWAGPRSVALLVGTDLEGREGDSQPVVAVDLQDQTRTVLSAVPDASGDFAVSRLQVPQRALTAAAQRDGAVPAPHYEHGRGAVSLLVLGVVFLAGAAGLLVAATAGLGRRATSPVRARVGGGPRPLS